MLASLIHKATVNTKTPYTVTGIIIHKLAVSLFKPRGSKRGKKVAAYSPEMTVTNKRPRKSDARTGFYSLARAMPVRCPAGPISVGLASNNLLAVLLYFVCLLDVWLCEES